MYGWDNLWGRNALVARTVPHSRIPGTHLQSAIWGRGGEGRRASSRFCCDLATGIKPSVMVGNAGRGWAGLGEMEALPRSSRANVPGCDACSWETQDCWMRKRVRKVLGWDV